MLGRREGRLLAFRWELIWSKRKRAKNGRLKERRVEQPVRLGITKSLKRRKGKNAGKKVKSRAQKIKEEYSNSSSWP